MRKSIEAIKGDKLQNIRTNKIYQVADIAGNGLILIDEETLFAKHFKMSNIRRWFRMYEEYIEIPEVVEPDNTILTDIDDADNLDLDEDLQVILEQLDCTATQRKEYLGIYKDGYRGCVAMLITSKKGNLHIDMKEKIYRALDEEVRQQIEVKYTTGIYDRTRGYFRISECDDLKVLSVVLRTALNM